MTIETRLLSPGTPAMADIPSGGRSSPTAWMSQLRQHQGSSTPLPDPPPTSSGVWQVWMLSLWPPVSWFKSRAAHPCHVSLSRERKAHSTARAHGLAEPQGTQDAWRPAGHGNSRDPAGLTWATMVLSGRLLAGWGVAGSPLEGGGSSPPSGPLAAALSSRAVWDRMAAMQSSTWRCRKLFQVYLKNRSCRDRRRGMHPICLLRAEPEGTLLSSRLSQFPSHSALTSGCRASSNFCEEAPASLPIQPKAVLLSLTSAPV